MLSTKPHLHPAQAPSRAAYLLRGEDVWIKSWGHWSTQSAQRKILKVRTGQVLLAVFASEFFDVEATEEPRDKSAEIQRRLDLLPRLLKQAVKRVHEHRGHPSKLPMLRALRILDMLR